MKKYPVIALFFLLTLLLAACAGQGPGAGVDLTTGEWTLTELNGQPPIAGSTVTIRFENGQVGGRAGCNSYGGQYTLDGQQLSMSELVQTEMACMEPAGVMEQETAYLQTLSQVTSAEIADDQLLLKNAAGETVLVFSQ